jgi:cytochrome c oxidase subunit 3
VSAASTASDLRLRPAGWYGMWLLIATEIALFGSLLSSYYYLRAGQSVWPPDGIRPPELLRPAIATALLLGSSLPLVLAEAAIRRGRVAQLQVGIAVTMALGVAFLGLQGLEYGGTSLRPASDAYSSLFFTITGVHGLHVAIGLALLGYLEALAWAGHVTASRHEAVQNVFLYWHFVDVVWLAIVATVYVYAHL